MSIERLEPYEGKLSRTVLRGLERVTARAYPVCAEVTSPIKGAKQMRRKELILQILGTPLTTLLGFVSGLLFVMTGGLLLFDNYEYFLGSEGLPGVIGIIVILGCSLGGALAPWLPRKS